MAVGKSKKQGKGGKKSGKKKQVDPFTKKEWYEIKAINTFQTRTCARTLVTKSQGTKLASDGLKGRVVELNLADLNTNTDQFFRKFKLCIEDVQGSHCLTQFHGYEITRDKLQFLVKKWHTTIECYCDCKTSDGFVLRIFAIGFTKSQKGQLKRHSYCKSTRERKIRQIMHAVIKKEVESSDIRELVNKLIPDSIGSDICRSASRVFPLESVTIRKVKILKKPKFDLGRLMEMHGESTVTAVPGEIIDKPDKYEPPVQAVV